MNKNLSYSITVPKVLTLECKSFNTLAGFLVTGKDQSTNRPTSHSVSQSVSQSSKQATTQPTKINQSINQSINRLFTHVTFNELKACSIVNLSTSWELNIEEIQTLFFNLFLSSCFQQFRI